jgi:hypothetical protein
MGLKFHTGHQFTPIGTTEPAKLLVRRIHWDDLPGFISRTLEVPPDHLALCRDSRGNMRSLGPGKHRVRSLWQGLAGLQGYCYLATKGPWSAHVLVNALPTADGMSVEADFLVLVEPLDLAALVPLMHPQREGLTEAELAEAIAEACEHHLEGLTRSYLEQDLCYTRDVAHGLERELFSFLGNYLVSWGLRVRAVTHLAFIPTHVAIERAERLLALREGLSRLEQQAAQSQEERRRQWEEFLAQKEHQPALEALRRDLELEQTIASMLGSSQATTTPDTASSFDPKTLQERLQSLRTTLEASVAARVDRLLRRQEKRPPAEAYPDPSRNLLQVVTVLRWTAGLFGSTTTFLITFAPGLFPNPEIPHRLTAAVSFGITIATFTVSIWLKRRAQARRQQTAASVYLLGRLKLRDRQETDRVVRGEVAGALERVSANVETARKAAFRTAAGRDLAVQLHQLMEECQRIRQQVLSTPSGGAPWLTAQHLTPEALLKMLIFDTSLIRSATELALQSEDLASAALAHDFIHVRELANGLRDNLLHLQNRFKERGRLAPLLETS